MITSHIPLLTELNIWSVLLRLLLAILFGGIIGIDRGRKRRPAGLRTHMLVSLGAALVMVTNQYVAEQYVLGDPSRLGAQVISGIGFLCAGTIIVTQNQHVKGLTTAAGLWCSACMGLAVGIGFYEGAAIACFLTVLIVIAMHRLDNRVLSRSKVMELYVEMRSDAPLSILLGYLESHSIRVSYIEITKCREQDNCAVAALLTIRLPHRFEHYEVLLALQKLEGIAYMNEV